MRRTIFPGWLLPVGLVLPQLLLTIVFFFLPAGVAIWSSLIRSDPFGLSSVFVGWDNFTDLFTDPLYVDSICRTIGFVVAVCVLSMGIALLLAVAADGVVRGRGFYRTMLIWPYAVAPAVAAIIWLFLLHPQIGLFGRWMNRNLGWDYALNGSQAAILVVLASAWKEVSYNFIFFVAGLQSVPRTVTEAARMDGARGWRRFRTITLPLLMPTIFFLLVVNVVYAAFDTFGTIWALTQGGPGKATETLLVKVYRDGVINLDLGSSSAQSVILMTGVIVLTAVQFRVLRTQGVRNWPTHMVLVLGVLLFAFPLWMILAGSTQDSGAISRGDLSLVPNLTGFGVYGDVLAGGGVGGRPVGRMLLISLGMALAIAIGKIVISVLSAYAVTFFRWRFQMVAFWAIFITLMLPVEVRIIPTYAVMAGFGMINTFGGLTVPLIASATATLLFRQVFLAVPDELMEAARMDGAGPWRFLRDILLPVSAGNVAALFVILFVYGWNQYLWPLLVATDPKLDTIVIGIVKMIGIETQVEWNRVMATAVLALLPPVAVVLLMQRWFVAGLTEGEK